MSQRINKKVLRQKLARMGIFKLTDLARMVPCSHWAVHTACSEPHRVPRVRRRIKELTNV